MKRWPAAAFVLLSTGAERLRGQDFRTAERAFDPAVAPALTHVQIADFPKSALGTFLTPVAGRVVKRECLL